MKIEYANQNGGPADGGSCLDWLDAEIIRRAWCAEQISREIDRPFYQFWPPMPGDAGVAAAVGAKLAAKLHHPVLVWRNSPEET